MNDLFTTTDNPISKITRPYVHLHVIKEEIPSSFPHTHTPLSSVVYHFCKLLYFYGLQNSCLLTRHFYRKGSFIGSNPLAFPTNNKLVFFFILSSFFKILWPYFLHIFFLKNQSVFIIITISFLEDVVSLFFI